jgi:hypothetical protein
MMKEGDIVLTYLMLSKGTLKKSSSYLLKK